MICFGSNKCCWMQSDSHIIVTTPSHLHVFFSLCLYVYLCFSFTAWLCSAWVVTGFISPFYAHLSCAPLAVGPLELANALAACCLSSRLSSQHRQWAAQQLVRTLAAHDRDNQSRPQTFADVAGDMRKWSTFRLEAHQSRVWCKAFWNCSLH